MKKCSFCYSELRPSEGGEPACWLCSGDAFEEETKEAARLRKKQERKIALCCPNPKCPPQLRPDSERHCVACGEMLKEATLELWFEKCVKPALEEGVADVTATIQMARLMGIATERAETRLNEYSPQNSKHVAGAQGAQDSKKETEATDVLEDDASDFEQLHAPLTSVAGMGTEPPRVQLDLRKFRWPLRIFLICVLVCIAIVFYLRLRTGATNPRTPSSPTAANASKSSDARPDAPPGMTYIPGGEFMMGRDREQGGDNYESPSRPVRVEAVFIDTHEVTREEYRKCVDARKCPVPWGWANRTYPPNTGRWPVTGVDWEAANAYAQWVEKRLPTEEEWEFAARGSDGRLYPWGAEWREGLANAHGASNDLADVGQYEGKSPFEVFDMVGNAWEWTSSTLHSYPNGHIKEDKLPAPARQKMKVIRGGCYLSDSKVATVTYRRGWPPPQGSNNEQTGFRCARSVPK